MEMSEEEREIRRMRGPYQWAMYNDWKRLKQFYKNNPQQIVTPLTANGDTVLHAVAFSTGLQVLQFFIDLLPDHQQRRDALKMKNGHGNTTLHEVAVSGNLEAARLLMKYDAAAPDHDDDPCCRLLEIGNSLGETPLYRAAAMGHTNLVKYFAGLVEKKDMHQKHFHRNIDQMSILHIAVISQHFDTALWLQKNYPSLAEKREDNGFTGLQLLAQMPSAFENKFRKSTILKQLIYRCLPNYDHYVDHDPDANLVPPKRQGDLESDLGYNQPHQHSSCFKKLTVCTLKVYIALWIFLAKGWPGIHMMWKEKKNQVQLSALVHLLVEKDYSWTNTSKAKDRTISLQRSLKEHSNMNGGEKLGHNILVEEKDEKPKSEDHKQHSFNRHSTPLLIATSTGILEIVEKILEVYPQAVEHVSKDEHNILHMAIKHRRLEIFKLVKRCTTVTARLSPRIDSDGNTILHQAADTTYYSTATQPVVGPAMQLKEELRWMERAENIAPRHYNMHHNKNNKSAETLFKDEHAGLLQLAQDWTKTTTQSCSAVAALVATVVFAAAFTVPGGNNPNGDPVLRRTPIFWIFTISDMVSLVSSLTSLVMFLSILTSPFEYQDFRHSIPRKVTIGFCLLFFSVITTMVTFTTAIVILIRHKEKWTKSLIFTFASLPVSVFGLAHFPLFKAFAEGLKFIFKNIRQTLPGNMGRSKRKILGKTKPYILKCD